MASSTATAKRRLAETLLERSLSEYVSYRRLDGKSWREISLDLREDIDLDIHPDTLRVWFTEEAA